MTKIIKASFAGENGSIRAIHIFIMSQVPHEPNGDTVCQIRMKNNPDGVTSQLNIEVPDTACDHIFGPGWRQPEESRHQNCDTEVANRANSAPHFKIRYRD